MKKALSVILMIFFIQSNAQDMKEAYFASGCFWCVESIFESLEGVTNVQSGYSGGWLKNPSYSQVLTGKTGHAESVKVSYKPNKISFAKLVEVFFASHDPTTLNRQGPDIGSQYRSEIFFYDEEQKRISLSIIEKISKKFDKKIVTQVSGIKNYTKAEEYHQKYLEKNQF